MASTSDAAPGVDHVEHGHGQLGAQLVEPGRGRGVARDDDRLDAVVVDEAASELGGVAAHLVERLGPVRVAPGVTDVDEVLARQEVDHGPRDGEAAEARVEHPDRPIHGIAG